MTSVKFGFFVITVYIANRYLKMWAGSLSVLLTLLIIFCKPVTSSLNTFEKVNGVIISGRQPLSSRAPATLSMCIKACSVKTSCKSISFFVSNLTCFEFDVQTDDGKVTLLPNAYSLNKISVTTSSIFPQCSSRLWASERYVHKALPPGASTHIPDRSTVRLIDAVSGRLRCTELCLQETTFICRAFQYNYSNKQCTLFSGGRRVDALRFLITDQNVDYVENLCIFGTQRCPNFVSFERYSDVVFPPFYFDKTLPATSPYTCGQLCTSELDFLCRSFLYDPAHQQCALSHSDRLSLEHGIMNALPRVYATVLGRPLTEFYDVICISEARCSGFSAFTRHSTFDLIPKNSAVLTIATLSQCKDACLKNENGNCKFLEYNGDSKTCTISSVRKQSALPRTAVGEGDFLENTCNKDTSTPKAMPPGNTDSGVSTSQSSASVSVSPSTISFPASTSSSTAFPAKVSTTAPVIYIGQKTVSTTVSRQNITSAQAGQVMSITPASTLSTASPTFATTNGGDINTTVVPVSATSNFTSPIEVNPVNFTMATPQIGVACRFSTTNGKIANEFVNRTIPNISLNHCQIHCESHSDCLSFSYSPATNSCLVSSYSYAAQRGMLEFIANSDFQFYEKGTTCTDIRFECTDSDILIKVNLDKPFHGRIFVDGVPSSSQCSSQFPNQRSFTWALPLSAQPCSTVYEGDGLFSNMITLQYHDMLVTKNDRKYRVNCKYDIGVINVTSDTLSVASTEFTSIVTASPTPPELNIAITDLDGNMTDTATVGDTLLLNIAVPENSTYGIGAKNCYASGENSKERMQLTDEIGCPVLPEYFRPFVLKGKSLQADFDAFRFQNSFDITYQCTVQYCLNICPQPICNATPGMEVKVTSRGKRSIHTWEDEVYIGAFNIRKVLRIQDMAPVMELTEDRNNTANVCMATSISIILIVIACVLLLFDVIVLLAVIWIRQRCVNKAVIIMHDN